MFSGDSNIAFSLLKFYILSSLKRKITFLLHIPQLIHQCLELYVSTVRVELSHVYWENWHRNFVRTGMDGKWQFQQVILRRRYVVIHSRIQKCQDNLLLDECQVFELSNFRRFIHGVVQVNLVDNVSLLIKLNFLEKDSVKFKSLIGSIVPSLSDSLHEFFAPRL